MVMNCHASFIADLGSLKYECYGHKQTASAEYMCSYDATCVFSICWAAFIMYIKHEKLAKSNNTL